MGTLVVALGGVVRCGVDRVTCAPVEELLGVELIRSPVEELPGVELIRSPVVGSPGVDLRWSPVEGSAWCGLDMVAQL